MTSRSLARFRACWQHDVTAVMRWIEGGAADGFVKRLPAAIEPQQVQ